MDKVVWQQVGGGGLRLLRSRRLAILLLVAFLAACLVGNFGFPVFQTAWFGVLSALLALSTFACTLDQFARARRRRPDGPVALGRWGSPLFHLGLVMIFVTVVAGALTRWSAAVVLPEGGSFDATAQPLHGLTRSALAPAPSAGRLPRLQLVTHFPRYRRAGYAPDAASEVLVNGEKRLIRYGSPVSVGGATLRQDRRYGALAEVVLRPAGKTGEVAARGGAGDSPSAFGGLLRRADGSYQAGLVFVNQADADQQRRVLYLDPVGATGTFRLVPGPAAARYDLPLDRRFQLAVQLSPGEPVRKSGPAERRLSVGETLPLGPWHLEFRSLRYWTTLTLSATPLTPLFFAFAWWCVLALGLGVVFPDRRKEEEP